MFGYVLPAQKELPQEEQLLFQSAYCGLCHTLKRRYGWLARLHLNYDMAFLAILLRPPCETVTRRCLIHPVKGRACACCGDAFDTAADMSVILLWWKIQDEIADRRFAIVWRILRAAFKRAYRKASALQVDFDTAVARQIRALSALEQANCASLDAPADCFAKILEAAAEQEQNTVRRRILRQELYHLGRWIYLVDAADDLKKDMRRGNYNPLAHRFSPTSGTLSPEDRRALGRTLDASVRQIAAAFELDKPDAYRPVVENVVYEGLYLVGAAVLDGTFHQRVRGKRMKQNGKAGSANG